MNTVPVEIIALPALTDNYIWALRRAENVLIVDPGAAEPVHEYLNNGGYTLRAILLTHRHNDHIAGVADLCTAYPHTEVFAPQEASAHATQTSKPGYNVQPTNWSVAFTVYATPGHTVGHISYVGDGALLCGDALFSCGCGRLFEGNAKDLAASMAIFTGLDDDLRVCCGHEYTLANIAFARTVEPDNTDLEAWEATATGMRADCKPTLPVTLRHEHTVNPFLRASKPAVRAAAAQHAGNELNTDIEVLAALRAWKDNF